MRIKEKVDKVLEKVLIALMVVLVLDVLWQVIARYLNKFLVNHMNFHIPTGFYSFTDELAGFLLIWVALMGAAYATGKKQHLAIDLLSDKLKPANRVILRKVINSLIFIFAVSVMVTGGSWLVYTRFYLGQLSSAMEIPIGAVYLVLPLSGLLITYYVVYDFFTISTSSFENTEK
jgi:TRAP-type C4-dicarboxylate transport system permease small subunit